MEYVAALGGFLVVTASEDEANAFHGNMLWFVADGQTNQACKIATFEVAMKAEGLTVLGAEKNGTRTAVKLLITYDNDPHATKIPTGSRRRLWYARRTEPPLAALVATLLAEAEREELAADEVEVPDFDEGVRP